MKDTKSVGSVSSVSDQFDYAVRNTKYMLIMVGYLFNEETKRNVIKRTPIHEGASDHAAMQTHRLVAVQSKIFDFSYKRGEVFKKEHFVLSYIKAILRASLDLSRQNQFSLEQARQVIADHAFICDLFSEMVDKEEESLIQGFYFTIADSIRNNCPEGDPFLKSDKLAAINQKKRSAMKFYN